MRFPRNQQKCIQLCQWDKSHVFKLLTLNVFSIVFRIGYLRINAWLWIFDHAELNKCSWDVGAWFSVLKFIFVQFPSDVKKYFLFQHDTSFNWKKALIRTNFQNYHMAYHMVNYMIFFPWTRTGRPNDPYKLLYFFPWTRTGNKQEQRINGLLCLHVAQNAATVFYKEQCYVTYIWRAVALSVFDNLAWSATLAADNWYVLLSSWEFRVEKLPTWFLK